MPLSTAWSRSVVCLPTFMTPFHPPVGNRHPEAQDPSPARPLGSSSRNRWGSTPLRIARLQDLDCKMGVDPRPPPNPIGQKKLNGGGRQFQLTLFYRLLPRCSRIRAAALSQIGTGPEFKATCETIGPTCEAPFRSPGSQELSINFNLLRGQPAPNG